MFFFSASDNFFRLFTRTSAEIFTNFSFTTFYLLLCELVGANLGSEKINGLSSRLFFWQIATYLLDALEKTLIRAENFGFRRARVDVQESEQNDEDDRKDSEECCRHFMPKTLNFVFLEIFTRALYFRLVKLLLVFSMLRFRRKMPNL